MNSRKSFRHPVFALLVSLAFATLAAFPLHAGEVSSPAPGVLGMAPVDPLLQSEFDSARATVKGFAVASAAEYQRMKDYHDSLVGDEAVLHSFTNQEGDPIVCVDIHTQPSIREAGPGAGKVALKPTTLPGEDRSAPRAHGPRTEAFPGSQWLDGSHDESGRPRECPADTFPMLVPKFETLLRHKSLDEYYRKSPDDRQATDGKQSAPLTGAVVHEYAHAWQFTTNIGHGADFSIWQPYTETAAEFSLSQLWCVRGSGTGLQTVELGWQVYRQLYGDYRPRLFVYYTRNGYSASGDYKGCYNLTCKGFVQVNKGIVVGSPLSPVSKVGGAQYHSTLEAWRDPGTGHWWIRYNGQWVGYYPTSLFASTGLKYYSDRVDLGGEIIDDKIGGHTATDMGSGRFPKEGYGRAAFTKKIHYWSTSNRYYEATGLSRQVTNAYYYDLALHSYSDANWRRTFFFGGPGR